MTHATDPTTTAESSSGAGEAYPSGASAGFPPPRQPADLVESGPPSEVERPVHAPSFGSPPADAGHAAAPASNVPAIEASPRESVPAPSQGAPGGAPAVAAMRVRSALGSPAPRGMVLAASLVVVLFVGILFATIFWRLGEIDQRVQTTVEHTETQLSSSLQAVTKDVAAVKADLEAMKPQLENSAMRQQVQQTAATVTAIEQRLIQLSEPPAEGAATKGAPPPAPAAPPDRFR